MVLGGYDSTVIEPGEYHEYTPAKLDTGFFVVDVRDATEDATQYQSEDFSGAFRLTFGKIPEIVPECVE